MSSTRKVSLIVALMLVVSLLATACGSGTKTTNAPAGKDTTTTQTPAAKKPAVGGEINIRLTKDPDSFNSVYYGTTYGFLVNTNVYASLFTFNTKWEPTPQVAKEWTVAPDGLTVTIKLRDDVKFSDGTPLTADDVVFTLGTLLDKDYTGPRKSSVVGVKSITASDKTTVVFTLDKPNSALLTNINYGIMSKKYYEGVAVKDLDKAKQNDKPLGAGPYIFKEFVRGQYVLLERNPNWFLSKETNGGPFIQTVRYKIVTDDQTALAALENGELDLDTPIATEVSRLIKDDQAKLTEIPYERNGWGYITINTTRPGLDNKLVRQALTYGIDRASIIASALDGRAVIPAGPIPNVSWAYDASIKAFPYDVAKAKQLMEQAGYKLNAQGIYEKDGKPMKLNFYASSGSPLIESLATIAKKNWKDMGIDVDVQLMDFNAMLDNYVKPGKFDVTFSGFSLGLDPDSQFALFHSSAGKPDAKGLVQGFNRMRFENKDIDTLLEQGRQASDPAKRKQIYSDFQKKLVDEAPIILIYANKYSDFQSKKLKGVVNYPGQGAMQLNYFWQWYVNEQ